MNRRAVIFWACQAVEEKWKVVGLGKENIAKTECVLDPGDDVTQRLAAKPNRALRLPLKLMIPF